MTQEELDAMEISFKQHGFTWNQTNFAVAVIRSHVEPLRQQLAALTMQCEKLVKWKHLMSYNDSYFGEHAGDLKRVVYEIDRSMPIRGDK